MIHRIWFIESMAYCSMCSCEPQTLIEIHLFKLNKKSEISNICIIDFIQLTNGQRPFCWLISCRFLNVQSPESSGHYIRKQIRTRRKKYKQKNMKIQVKNYNVKKGKKTKCKES